MKWLLGNTRSARAVRLLVVLVTVLAADTGVLSDERVQAVRAALEVARAVTAP